MQRSILIIDDEESIRAVTRTSLEIVEGWSITCAGSAREGIAAAEADPPDAILLDVMMPGADGPQTFRELQANTATQNIPVLFLTATVRPADVRRLHSLGVKGVVAKPFDPLTLGTEIARILGWDRTAPTHQEK
ncbi:MAG: response regulator [Terriglobia bacterium]